jgi:DNA-binding CsgD family transcriptional regulator
MHIGAAEGRVAFLHKLGLDAVIIDSEGRVLAPHLPHRLPRPFERAGDRATLVVAAEHGHLGQALASLADRPPGWKTMLAAGDDLVVLMRDHIDAVPVTIAFVVKRHLERRVCPLCLRDAFGFTEREAELAALVASGRPLQDAADRLGISVATARTHLRHIFLKAGIESQNELVALVAASAFGTCKAVCHDQAGEDMSRQHIGLRQMK